MPIFLLVGPGQQLKRRYLISGTENFVCKDSFVYMSTSYTYTYAHIHMSWHIHVHVHVHIYYWVTLFKFIWIIVGFYILFINPLTWLTLPSPFFPPNLPTSTFPPSVEMSGNSYFSFHIWERTCLTFISSFWLLCTVYFFNSMHLPANLTISGLFSHQIKLLQVYAPCFHTQIHQLIHCQEWFHFLAIVTRMAMYMGKKASL